MVPNLYYRQIKQTASRYKHRSDGYREERDYWKSRALAYREIIKRAQKDYRGNCIQFIQDILAEVDRLEGK